MAMELPLPPFQLEYQGGDADKHTADALYMGQSSWSRLSEQNFRFDKWNVCRG